MNTDEATLGKQDILLLLLLHLVTLGKWPIVLIYRYFDTLQQETVMNGDPAQEVPL